MKKLMLLLSLIVVPRTVPAQAEAALSATRVRDFILLAGRTDRIDFAVDATHSRAELMKPLGTTRLFAVTQGHSVNVVLTYLNPLAYTWSISTRETADPVVASVEKMLASAADFPGLLVSAAGASGAPATGTAPQPMTISTLIPGAEGGEGNVPSFTDPSLIEWTLWTALHPDCIAVSGLQAAREQAAAVDSLLYLDLIAKDARVSTAGAFKAVAAGAIASLRGASSLKGLLDSLVAVDKALASLEAGNKAAADHLTAMGVHARALRGAATPDDTTMCPVVRMYSQRVFEGFVARGTPVVSQRTALVSEMRLVVKEIRDRLGSASAEDIGFVIGQVTPTSGKRVSATVTVTRRDVAVRTDHLSSEAGKSVSATFEVMEHQSVITQLSPGVAYSPVVFPRFATNDTTGGHVIVDAGDYRPNTIVMEMLNLIPNTGWSGFTRLVGQIGLGVTKEAAVALVGGGIRFTQPTPFVVSFGALFPFIQALKDGVHVGDAIAGEAALVDNVQRVLGRRPSFYVGIQR